LPAKFQFKDEYNAALYAAKVSGKETENKPAVRKL
jgi:hypothetical protein